MHARFHSPTRNSSRTAALQAPHLLHGYCLAVHNFQRIEVYSVASADNQHWLVSILEAHSGASFKISQAVVCMLGIGSKARLASHYHL